VSVETVSRSRRYVTRLRVPRVRWVASVTASILLSHIHNQRFWALCLNFEGGDERIFGVDDYMLGSALQLQSDSELQWALLIHFSLPQLRRGEGNQETPPAMRCGSYAISIPRKTFIVLDSAPKEARR
jgi:hypothetical protein